VVVASTDGPKEPSREPSPQGELCHSFQVIFRCDRHDPSDDRHPYTRQIAPLPEVIEVGVAEEKLGTDIVCACVHLLLKVFQFLESVRSAGMSLWKTGNADPEPSRAACRPS